MYRFLCYAIYFSGVPWLIRKLAARGKVSIILYHDPPKEVFGRHIEYLKKTYRIISFSEYMEVIENNTALPNINYLIVTFDDGHKGNYNLVSIFKKENIRPTIYLCSSIVNTTRRFWFKLPGIKRKDVKRLPHEKRLKHLDEMYNFKPEKSYGETGREALSGGEIREMFPYVDFQSHTCFHPILTTCSDEEALAEIAESRNELEKLIGDQVIHFAYPNGDYTEREIQFLRNSGFRSGRTTDVGRNDHNTDPFRLRITGVSDFSDLIMLKAELSGIPSYLYNIFTAGITKMSLMGKHIPEVSRR